MPASCHSGTVTPPTTSRARISSSHSRAGRWDAGIDMRFLAPLRVPGSLGGATRRIPIVGNPTRVFNPHLTVGRGSGRPGEKPFGCGKLGDPRIHATSRGTPGVIRHTNRGLY